MVLSPVGLCHFTMSLFDSKGHGDGIARGEEHHLSFRTFGAFLSEPF